MKLKNKKTGEIVEFRYLQRDHVAPLVLTTYENDKPMMYSYNSLAELNAEWEDYEEPKEYMYVLPNKVRRAILSWVRVQDNPIEKISILLKSYYDTHEVDSDGFYDYEFFGYVSDNNKNLVANTLTIRLKKPFAYKENKDYTLPELGIIDNFGGEE